MAKTKKQQVLEICEEVLKKRGKEYTPALVEIVNARNKQGVTPGTLESWLPTLRCVEKVSTRPSLWLYREHSSD
jgi:hypothetical protein